MSLKTEYIPGSGGGGGMEVHGNEYHDPDFEQEGVAAALVDGHKDLTTGAHGAGANHLALAPAADHLVRSFTKGWTLDKILVGAGADVNPSEAYEVQAYWGTSPTLHEWQLEFSAWTATVTLSGTATKNYGICKVDSGATANATARARGYNFGWIGWASFYLQSYCNLVPRGSVSSAVRWFKIDADTAADPTGCAIGWRLDNLALKGIVHNGTNLYVIDLATTFEVDVGGTLMMLFKPGNYCRWYVNGVLKGEETDPAHLPNTLRALNHYPVLAITNGASGGACSVEIWQQGWTKR